MEYLFEMNSKIHELNIQPKKPLGQGTEHTAFPYEKFQDKVIKTRNGNVEVKGNKFVKTNNSNLNQEEIQTFKDNPDLFAHVYKSTDRYAILEKLNTHDIRKDLDELTEGMIKFFIRNPNISAFFTPKDPTTLETDDFNVSADIMINRNDKEFLKGVLKNTKNKDFFRKLLTFIKTVYSRNLPKKSIDIHDGNLGYDKQGNIKLLDI